MSNGGVAEVLERRALLSAVSYDPTSGTVTLTAETGEENNVWVNGHAGNLNLRDGAGLEIADGHEEFFVRQSEQSVWLRGHDASNVVLELGDADDKVVAGGSRLPIFMNLGLGNDRVVAGSRVDDVILGGPGNDVIYGYGGDDRISGDSGDDTLYGSAGDDTVSGGDGNDRLFGGNGIDVIHGGSGNDELHGQGGDDQLYGGPQNDVLRGGHGQDELFGEAGSDLLIAQLRGSHRDKVVDGGAGVDVLWTSRLEDVDSALRTNVELDLPTAFRTFGLKRKDLFNWQGIGFGSEAAAT